MAFGIAGVGGGRHPDLCRQRQTGQLAMEIVGKDPSPCRRRLRQHDPDDVVLAPPSMGRVIGGPNSGGNLDPEVTKQPRPVCGTASPPTRAP